MWTDEQKMMWEKLHERTCSMFSVWQLYTALYGDETTVERMNEISGLGFRIVQNCMLHEQIRLAMALTDRAGKGKQTNLSIDRLIQTLPSNVAESIENTLGSMTNSMQVLRQHRNQRLMHFDLDTATGNVALPRLLTDDLEAVVHGIGTVMSDISVALTGNNWAYEFIGIDNANGAMQWMILDVGRFKHLRQLASASTLSDSQLREMLRYRSGRQDDLILKSGE